MDLTAVLEKFCTMGSKRIKLNFPLWQFLNQPVFNSQKKLILDPGLFAYRYRVQLLERCLTKECGSNGYRCN